MTKRNPDTVPVEGAAWTDMNAAMQVLLERFNQFEIAQRQMQTEVAALRDIQDTQRQAYMQELAEQKEASTQALTAAREALQQLQEKRPKDPKVIKAVIEEERKRAAKIIATKRKNFREYLSTCTKGTINNYTNQIITLGVNGFSIKLKPGINTNVPEPFLEEWEKHIVMSEWVAEQDKHAQGIREFGELQMWRARNTVDPNSTKNLAVFDDQTGFTSASIQEFQPESPAQPIKSHSLHEVEIEELPEDIL